MSDSPVYAARATGHIIEVAVAAGVIVAGFAVASPMKTLLVGGIVMAVGNLVARVPTTQFAKWPMARAAIVVVGLLALDMFLVAVIYWGCRGIRTLL